MASDSGLPKRLRRLSSSLVCDILDDYYDGVTSKKYLMRSQIRPVFPGMKVSGVAKTFSGGLSAGTAETAEGPPTSEPNQKGNAALESIGPGQVVVYGTNRCRIAACWGELMSTAASTRGGAGLVTDGLARDLDRIRTIRPVFPVFSEGSTPSSGKGRFALREFDVPIWCGGVPVTPGDLILGDLDGVVVIPKDIALDVVTKSEDRLKTERTVRTAFRKKAPISDIMRRYKVG